VAMSGDIDVRYLRKGHMKSENEKS
jgi:hypothetical protein